MFLKSIDLFGFKSFAEKSHIQFTDGISALIGPNGCGKSNVVDAVKWVLGEQATRSLRAERMEDIIFNGTDTRKPLNVAEVTLTLENDGVLPLDFPEITVRRRLFRNGESEYFVNGASVKLRDVRELFYDTGIGKSAYSIMEQGRIDQILSNRPEDRRALFEEAAGITRYKMRGREADRKLERTEANMHEVESVLHEVRRSYENLKKQASKTEIYRKLRDEQFNLEVDLQIARLRQYRTQEEQFTSRSEAAVEERDQIKGGIDELNRKLESELNRVNSMESRLVEVQKRLYGLELEKGSRTERVALIREQKTQLDDRVQSEEGQCRGLERKLGEQARAAEESERAATEMESQIHEAEGAIKAVQERIARSQERRQDARDQIAKAEEKIAGHHREVEECQREIRAVTDELVEALDSKLRESGYSSAERIRNEESLNEALEHFRITLRGRRDAVLDHLLLGEDPGERRTAAATAFASLEEAIQGVADALELYQGSIPRFLDEFLAPQGKMTRKRALDDRVESLQETSRALREKIRTLNGEIETLGSSIETERVNLEQMKLNRLQLQNRAGVQRDTARRHRREMEETERLRGEVEKRIERDRQRSGELEQQADKLQAEYEEFSRQEVELRRELRNLEKEIAGNNQNLREEEEKLKTFMQSLAKAQTKLEEMQVRVAEKRTEIRTLFDSFSERHGRDLREFETREPAFESDQRRLREETNRVRSELRDLGSVNLMAVEEFAEVSDRYDFLSGQLTDLKTARDDLIRVTAEIKRESEQLFVDTYNRIRKNFHTIFRRLFGGGRAELRLVDPDGILDSGIDILVQPPGKKLESITLLSGGERSLTAVALLFATFMVRPAPFTLLDEIDAALDEHNVARFVNMLAEFAEHSQFIVITHNKKTVAGANTLLGVTMEESGVSRVVAIRIGDNSEQLVLESTGE
ncbi:MAG: chromosome segregation protein SMC [Spirochaetaceae bacterium]|nr:MAG: chromosome segregation protein SMC [Spirochaetaceae bacterium]